MSFEGLLNDLEELKKAQAAEDDGAGDQKIADAAASDEDGDESGATPGDGDGDEDEGEEMGKSLTVTLPDGTEAKAFDGTMLIKSLQNEIVTIKGERATENEHLSKSLNLVTEMLGEQGKALKALGDQVAKMANQGAGRKAVVAIAGTDLAKSESASSAISTEELMNKCLAAQTAGKISGFEISLAESCINRGLPIPDSVRGKLL
jgi:hypothetical protein